MIALGIHQSLASFQRKIQPDKKVGAQKKFARYEPFWA